MGTLNFTTDEINDKLTYSARLAESPVLNRLALIDQYGNPKTHSTPGTAGQVLKSAGDTVEPTWGDILTLNGTANNAASFYAPITVGSADKLLKSTGSGAPSWTSSINVTGVRISTEPILQCGSKLIIPSGANTPTAASVTFPTAFTSAPVVVTGTDSSVPGTVVLGTSGSGATTTGFTIYVTRTNTTNTNVTWHAMRSGGLL